MLPELIDCSVRGMLVRVSEMIPDRSVTLNGLDGLNPVPSIIWIHDIKFSIRPFVTSIAEKRYLMSVIYNIYLISYLFAIQKDNFEC